MRIPQRFSCYHGCSHTIRNYSSFVKLKNAESVQDIFKGMVTGNRGSLAKAITLTESTRQDHVQDSHQLLSLCLNHLKKLKLNKPTFRIGLTGSPGAGKSTLIETLGKRLTNEGHKVAVLAVDPSSAKTGGSLLGDRTRMIKLSQDPNAFIRPSPSSGTLGGVTRKTNEAIILCETAGYDIILVETVGIGQSEFVVANMTDMFVLVIPPGSGDELQGLKKGVVEMADLVLVNKSDGNLLPAARKIQTEYMSALKLLRRPGKKWIPKVYPVSALLDEGLDKAWWKMEQYQTKMLEEEIFFQNRRRQYKSWMWSYIKDNVMKAFLTDKKVKSQIKTFEGMVESEQVHPAAAADQLVDIFLSNKK